MSCPHEIDRDVLVRAWEVRIDPDVFVVVSMPLTEGEELQPLTRAERDIVRQILHGDTNKQIALRRGTAVRTVANQIAAIYQKLEISSRAELAARSSRRGARTR